jgi:hypothetical protein
MIKNIIKIIIISGTLVLSSCVFNTTKISFSPIPYEMKVPQELASKLSVAPMTGDWANQIATAGVVGALTMYYTAEDNTKHIFAGIYYTPEERFNAAKNPNEPPMFGQEVSRKDGFVLSVAGPQDSIFESFTPDGKNITTLYEEIYKKTTYIKTN